MPQKNQHEIYEILKDAHREHSYNYSLDFGTPEFTPKTEPAFLDYWKFNDVLHAFNDPSSVNWQTIESIISNQTPMEIKQDLPSGWTRSHLQNFNYYLSQQNNKPIEISRYAGWAIANHMQNRHCDAAFQKAYFINPSAPEVELSKTAQAIRYNVIRNKMKNNVNIIGGIIANLAKKYKKSHAEISNEFWNMVNYKMFGEHYRMKQELKNKKPYLDYMKPELLALLNLRFTSLIEQWDYETPEKKQTLTNFLAMTGNKTSGMWQILGCAPIYLMSNKNLTKENEAFEKQEQKFIKQFVKSK